LVFQTHLKGQKKLAEVYKAKLVTDTHAGHYIQTEQPKLVVDAIREVVEKMRKGSGA
jgi:pimeloyl-ACP methyl ester carboxylesterase